MDHELRHEAASRRSLIKGLGAAMAAGIGIALIPKRANASSNVFNGSCCPKSSCGPCPSGQHPFFCAGTGQGCGFCQCETRTTCFNIDC